jgi:protein phosphatase
LRKSSRGTAAVEGLRRAFVLANQAILDDARTHEEREGMGTTAVAIALVDAAGGQLPVVVNIGDSRAYQLRDGALRQLSMDHSLAEEWVRQGRLTSEEAAVHPKRHQLTRVLGLPTDAVPDVFTVEAMAGDRILLCSDGLTNEVSDDEIGDVGQCTGRSR